MSDAAARSPLALPARFGPGPRRAAPWLALLALLTLGACARSLPPEAEPPRLVPLEGTLNTRDLGGYRSEDGRRVRWGHLYRSDQLPELDDDDVAELARLGIRRVFDLRTDFERQGQLDRLPPGVDELQLAIDYPSLDPRRLTRLILRGAAAPGYFEAMLARANRSFALEHGHQLSALANALAEPGALPALFHCTYGKDRTGFATAMIFEILGVPWEVVVEDYLLSNVYLGAEIDRLSRMIWLASLFRISRDDARDLLGVRRSYIEAARQAIVDEYGSMEAYLRAIGIAEETQLRLRAALLEHDFSGGEAG